MDGLILDPFRPRSDTDSSSRDSPEKREKFELQSRRIIVCIEAIVFSIVQTISEMFVAIISDVVSGQTMLRCHSTTLPTTTTGTNNISIQVWKRVSHETKHLFQTFGKFSIPMDAPTWYCHKCTTQTPIGYSNKTFHTCFLRAKCK